MTNFNLNIAYKSLDNNSDYYPGGMPMMARSFSPENYRYGMNGQEKDDEITNVSGSHTTALYWEYDTRLIKRWNLDPKPTIGISDYACFKNNPILFSDPFGDWIVGADGKTAVTFSINDEGKITWHNATPDVMRIGNAMLKTHTGKEVFDKMQKTKYPITMRISKETTKDRFGSTNKSYAYNKKTKVWTVLKADITIYEGNINDFKDKVDKGANWKDDNPNLMKEAYKSTGSTDVLIGDIGVHEGVHASDQNIKEGKKNDVEAVPIATENKFLEESMPIQKMEPRQPKQIPTSTDK